MASKKEARVGFPPIPVISIGLNDRDGVRLSWTLPRAYSRLGEWRVERGSDGVTFPVTVYTGYGTSTTDLPTFVDGQYYQYRATYTDIYGRQGPYSEIALFDVHAPEFNPSTPVSLNFEATGGTYNFGQHVTDMDTDDSKSYSLTFRYRPDITIDSTTGIVSVPSFAGGTTGSITVQVTDKYGLSDSTTCSVTVQGVSTEWNPTYPRVVAHRVGTINDISAAAPALAKFKLVMLFNHVQYASLIPLVAAIKAINPQTKCLPYTNLGEHKQTTPVTNAISANNWWLRRADGYYLSTYPTSATFASLADAGSAYVKVNPTTFTAADGNGRRFPQWFVNYYHTQWQAQAGWSDSILDGIYHDVVNTSAEPNTTLVTADYDSNGVNEDRFSETVRGSMAAGHIAEVTEWRTRFPTWWHFANVMTDINPDYPWHATIDQQYDGGLFEAAMGESWSPETWGGWSNMMARYRRLLVLLKGSKIAVFAATNTLGMNEYQLIRYGLCSTLMDNGYFNYNASQSYNDSKWFDEYDWNLGYPTETPRTSAYSLGVYVRQFDNGLAIVNPKGNGTRTITLPSAGSGKRWDRLSGTQAPTVNNGETNVTSVTINERDGLILKRVNA